MDGDEIKNSITCDEADPNIEEDRSIVQKASADNNKPRSIKKNYVYSLIARIVALLVPLVVTPYVSRIMGADGVGVCSYVASIVSYFTLFANLGIETYALREIAMHRDDENYIKKFAIEITLMKTILTAACLIVYYIVFIAILNNEDKILYLVYSSTLIAVAFNFTWFFQGIEKFNILAVASISAKVIYIALIFALVRDSSDLPFYAGIAASTTLIEYAISVPLVFFNIKGKVQGRINPFKHLAQCMVYFLPTIATEIYTVADKTMIGLITQSDFENGYYEYADKLVKIPLTVVTAVNAIVQSRMAYYYATDQMRQGYKLAEKTLNFACMLVFPMAFGYFAVARTAIPLYLGDGYEKCIDLVYVMAWLIPIIAGSGTLGSLYYTPVGKRKISAIFLCVGAVVNVALNSFMIYFWQSMGAAIASVIAEAVITALYIIFARRFISFRAILKIAYKYVIAAAIMGCIVNILNILLPANIGFLILEVVCGIIVYSVFLLIMRTRFFTDNIKQMFAKVRKITRRHKN